MCPSYNFYFYFEYMCYSKTEHATVKCKTKIIMLELARDQNQISTCAHYLCSIDVLLKIGLGPNFILKGIKQEAFPTLL